VCLEDRLRGRHQGSEDRWEAMSALSSRPFCPCVSRQVSLGDLSAAHRYTTRRFGKLASGSAYTEGHHPASHDASFPPSRPIYLDGRCCRSVIAVAAAMLMTQREEPDVSRDAEHKTLGAAAGGWPAARQWARLPPLGLPPLGPSPSPRSRAPLARPMPPGVPCGCLVPFGLSRAWRCWGLGRIGG